MKPETARERGRQEQDGERVQKGRGNNFELYFM